MKRSWIGLFLLLVLLILGGLATWGMGRIHEPIAKDLEQAAACSLPGDWESADKFFQNAKVNWKKWEHFRACLADHSPVEEIDAGFAELQVYSAAREDAAFAASCMALARKVAAVGEAHGLYWWNML